MLPAAVAPRRRCRRCFAAALPLLALLLTGCPSSAPENADTASAPLAAQRTADRSAGAFAQTDPWLLTTTDPAAARANHGIFLGNGFLGATFGPQGVAGENAVCFVAGVYDKNENLAPLPLWNRIALPSSEGGPYSQTLDMKRGVLVTKSGGVTVTAFVSRADPSLAVIHVKGAPPSAEPQAQDALPEGVLVDQRDVAAASPDMGWTRFVRITTGADSAEETLQETGAYADQLARHEAAWARLWKGRDIVIEGDPEAQQLVHKLMFDLLQSTREGGADSIAPETLSGHFYKGHIFWDADIWMFPALLAQHPDLARNLLDYRFRHLEAARRQAKAKGYAGADFPWESAASGKEVAPGGFSEGRHVTAGVGWAHDQYYRATGDKVWLRERGWPVLSGVADYFAMRAKKNPATGKWAITGVTGPDELKMNVDNNTYTNALARYCLLAATDAARTLNKRAEPRWAEVARSLALPFDTTNNRYLARDSDDGARTKQADGELVIYPAALPMDAKTAAATFDYHSARPITNGPAMTASIHALIAARLGRAEESEKHFRASYRPFVRGPFLLFSEKRSLDRAVFTTGAGGILQSVLYGFGGLDWQNFDRVGKDLHPVALPPSWKKLTITGIRRGPKKTYTLTVTPQGRTLTPE